jgi:carbamoylphosphate synthase small subunit
MFEALSVQKTPPEPHGRFTKPLQPQGFEALAGIDIKAIPRSLREPAATEAPHAAKGHKPTAAELREIRKQEQEAEEAARKHTAAVKAAETRRSHAKTAEAKARADWERSRTELDEAERALAELRSRQGR